MAPWGSCDKSKVVDAFYTNLFASHPEYKAKFSFGGDMSKASYATQRTKTIEYIDAAVAGSADPAGLADRHKGRGVGAGDFNKALACLSSAASANGCDTDFSGAIAAICGHF